MVLERLLWRVTCPDHANVRLLTVARRGFFRLTRKLILLHTSRLSRAPSRSCGEVSSSTHALESFPQSQQAGSMSLRLSRVEAPAKTYHIWEDQVYLFVGFVDITNIKTLSINRLLQPTNQPANQLVAKSSVMPQRPLRLRDRRDR